MEEEFDAKLDTYALQMEIKRKCLKVHIQLQVLNMIFKKKKSLRANVRNLSALLKIMAFYIIN